MIQRIQSLFLLLAAIALGSLIKVPFAMTQTASSPFFEDLLFNVQDHTILLILSIVGSAVGLISIFLYQKRGVQLRLGYLGIICSLFLAIVSFWLIYSNADAIESNTIEDQIGLYLPPIALVMFILANYFIKKDENTVKSMDRLR